MHILSTAHPPLKNHWFVSENLNLYVFEIRLLHFDLVGEKSGWQVQHFRPFFLFTIVLCRRNVRFWQGGTAAKIWTNVFGASLGQLG